MIFLDILKTNQLVSNYWDYDGLSFEPVMEPGMQTGACLRECQRDTAL